MLSVFANRGESANKGCEALGEALVGFWSNVLSELSKGEWSERPEYVNDGEGDEVKLRL